MLVDIPLSVDLEAIRGRRQQQIDYNLLRMNKGRVDHKYKIGDLVKLRLEGQTKLDPRFDRVKLVSRGTMTNHGKP